jgi:hypothetical protein
LVHAVKTSIKAIEMERDQLRSIFVMHFLL